MHPSTPPSTEPGHAGLVGSALLLLALALSGLALMGNPFAARGADHADSPDTSQGNLDANDLYVFNRGQNVVFALTVAPLLTPGEATETAAFHPDGLYEFKLDRERDGIEDAVIQIAVVGSGPDQEIDVRGPVPVRNGGDTESGLVAAPSIRASLNQVVTGGDIRVFAGPRDDPFYIDLFGDRSLTSVLNAAFSAALGEQVGADDEQTLAFDPDATDDLAGANTLALVVEIPKTQVASALGIGTADVFYAWATTSVR